MPKKRKPTAHFQRRAGIAQWFGSPLGQRLLAAESRLLAGLQGQQYHTYQGVLSMLPDTPGVATDSCYHHFTLGPDAHLQTDAANSRFEALPLADDSIDLMVLQHVLEFSGFPHQVLREANRVLIPGGRMIIAGFNPVSLLGAKTLAQSWLGNNDWHSNRISLRRLSDWLTLLDLRINATRFGCHEWPMQKQLVQGSDTEAAPWAERHDMPGGAIYLIEAIKERRIITPHRPKWARWKPDLVGVGAVTRAPSSKTVH